MTTQTTKDIEALTRAFYHAVDANDPAAFEKNLAPFAVFAFNDLDPLVGVDAIKGFVDAWKGNFKAVIHEVTAISADQDRGTAGVEIIVTYVFPDSRELKVKGASFLDVAAEGITGWRVYVDTSGLS